MIFTFLTDAESNQYCQDIVQAMHVLYHVPIHTAIELVNVCWNDADLRRLAETATLNIGVSDADLLYHELPSEWAARIANPCPYVGNESELVNWQLRHDSAKATYETLQNDGATAWR
jgi:hypothetical protein